MTTQRQEALKGNVTLQMNEIAKDEGRSPEEIRGGVAQGVIAIPFNPLHKNVKGLGIGKGLRTKVNANIGTSADYPDVEEELKNSELRFLPRPTRSWTFLPAETLLLFEEGFWLSVRCRLELCLSIRQWLKTE